MQGGSLGLASKPAAQQQLSLAARNAEALFEAKNVSEIRQIESRTRQDIEEKNLQLRQLVGDSYRDLIDGTDKIIDISTKCHSILGSVLAIQESFASLAVSVSTTPGSGQDGKEAVRRHRELHAVGGRVKYVMDTPEVIWGCLDAQEHLEAARRLLRVQEVHAQLQASFGGLVAAKFPVLAHQWQTVLKFRQNIHASALALLSTQAGLSSAAAADALAAVAMLEGQDTSAALQCFLTARKQWVEQQLEAAAASQGIGQGPPGAVLAQLAQSVQSCIAQVGELFTGAQQPPARQQQQPQADAVPLLPDLAPGGSLLQQVVAEDEADASELYFGSADGRAEGSSSPEAVQWCARAAALWEQLAPLQREQVADASSAWLQDIAASCNQHGLQLLQQCGSAEALLEAELAVHKAMAEWTTPPAAAAAGAGAAADGTPASSADAGAAEAPGRSPPDPFAAAAARLSRAASTAAGAGSSPSGSPTVCGSPGGSARQGRGGAAGASDWERTCGGVLGHKLDLWQVLFHAPFLERCKQLIAAALARADSGLQEPLATALDAAARHSPEPAGQLLPGAWPAFGATTTGDAAAAAAAAAGGGSGVDRATSLGVGVLGGQPSSTWGLRGGGGGSRSLSLYLSGSLTGEAAGDSAGFRREVHTILGLFDQQLHAALQAVLALTAAAATPASTADQQQPGTPGGPGRSTSLLLQHAGSAAGSMLRAGSLQPGSPIVAPGAQTGSATAATSAAAAAAAGKQRAPDLQAYAQQQCLALVQALAAGLQRQLAALPAPGAGPRGAPEVEQVLLLARLCSALAARSCMLPAFLGPPGAWPAAVKAGPHAGPPSGGAHHTGGLPASLAQGVGGLGPAAAALLRSHHPSLGPGGPQQQPGAAAAAAAQLTALQDALHGVACGGYATWAAWVGASLGGELAAAMGADELLCSEATPLSWAEVRLAGDAGVGADATASMSAAGLLDDLLDDAGGGAGGDMCFALPACPSAAVLQALSRACWEVRRAGEHLVTPDALQLLLWEVHGGALAALQQLLQRGAGSATAAGNGTSTPHADTSTTGAGTQGGRLTEKGVLQLLFDQRFLRDVLGGGQPLAALRGHTASTAAPAAATGAAAAGAAVVASSNGGCGPGPDAAAEAAARRRVVSGVEQQLQDLLDPIDWATYEPHLWDHVQRYYGRTAVLLGTLGQMSRPYGAEAPARPAPGAAGSGDINALNLLPVAPRFHYLPISTPSAASLPRGRGAALGRGAGAVAAKALLLGGGGGVGGTAGGGTGAQMLLPGVQQQQLPLASISAQASDLAAQYLISDVSGGGGGRGDGVQQGGSGAAVAAAAAAAAAGAASSSFLHPSADAAAAAGASALSALQAKLQGSSFGAFGSMLGDRAAEVTAMAQNFGDLLPSAGGLGGGLGGLSQSAVGGLLSSFARRDGSSAAPGAGGA